MPVTESRTADGPTPAPDPGSVRARTLLAWLDQLLRPVDGSRRLLLYGLVSAVLCAALLAALAPSPFPMMTSRSSSLEEAAASYMRGAPLLTAHTSQDTPLGPAGTLQPVGLADDQGLYLFGAIVGDVLGTADPGAIMIALYLALFAVAIAFYPLILWRLTGSLVVAAVAPFGLAALVVILQIFDLYWIVSWAILALLPAVLAVDRRSPARSLAVLAAIVLLAGVATSIRNHAGLPVLIAAAAMVLWRGHPWRLPARVASAAALCVVYILIPVVLMSAVQHTRDEKLAAAGVAAQVGGTHLFWHPAYLGLGYLPNAYGIRWDDTFGDQRAKREDPSIRYATVEYEHTLRRIYLDLLRADPGFVIGVNAKKAVVAVGWGAPALALLGLMLPALLAGHRRRADLVRWLLLISPAMGLGLAAGLVGIPSREYTVGWVAACALALILVGGLVVAAAESAVRHGASLRSLLGAPRQIVTEHRRARALTVATVVVPAVSVLIWFVAAGIREQALEWVLRTQA